LSSSSSKLRKRKQKRTQSKENDIEGTKAPDLCVVAEKVRGVTAGYIGICIYTSQQAILFLFFLSFKIDVVVLINWLTKPKKKGMFVDLFGSGAGCAY